MWKTFKTAALLLIVCLITRSQAYAQINLSFENTPVKTVLDAIKRQSRFSIIYQNTVFDKNDRVSITVSNATIEETMDLLKKQLPISWVRAGIIITILRTVPRAATKSSAESPAVVYLQGVVTDQQGEPLYGTTVYVKRLPFSVAANIDGKFSLPNVRPGDTIVFTNVGYESAEMIANADLRMNVKLKSKAGDLVNVSVTSGIHTDIRRRSTGAISTVDAKTLGRSTSSNIIERLEGLAPGFLVNRNIVAGVNQSEYSVRGRSTIYGNPNPLIVLDNFPYAGNLASINPLDVESITVLRDAAASAIWGAFSGNGVIVITTKKGRYNQKPKVSYSNTFISGDKPDLFYLPSMRSKSAIELEQFLFDRNFYKSQELSQGKPALSPVVELLIKKRDGHISEEELNRQLDIYRNTDAREDIDDLIMRRSFFQQHSISLRGGGTNNNYYLSAGYDEQHFNFVGARYRRFTINGNNTWQLINKKLEINTNILYSTSRNVNGTNSQIGLPNPYTKLKDENGNAAVVPYEIRQSYKDTVAREVLLDWNYRPLEDFNLRDQKLDIESYRMDIGLRYKILKGLQAMVMYQYVRENIDNHEINSQLRYFTRSLINKYTQISSGGEIIRNIPLGDIFDIQNEIVNSHNLRLKTEYKKGFGDHEITAIAGADITGTKIKRFDERLYGYNKENGTSQPVNLDTEYPMFQSPFQKAKIPLPFKQTNILTHSNFISVYGNLLYSYKSRYNLSLSLRKDESNLFGVKQNQKGVPLGSAGFSWNISKENFYTLNWLPELKLRITGGYNGNIDNTTSAYTAAVLDGRNVYGSNTASITNPPNPSLRWERARMLNVGIDFVTKNNRFSGSIDHYIRNAIDLIGVTPVDPTSGVELFRWNSSSMRGKGFELQLQTRILTGKFKWTTSLLASYSYDKVHDYDEKRVSINLYLPENTINPLPGNPLYSIYALKWAGLTTNSGDPIGKLNGENSTEYSKILNSGNFEDLLFMGSAVPVYFGSFINTLRYQGFELSCLFSYKLGYYFRRRSVDYGMMVQNVNNGHPDYELRWQKPGDENHTTVPSFKYPSDLNRDGVYKYAEINVERGDHVRLKDIRLSYSFLINKMSKQAANAEVFIYVNNAGLVWKDNSYGIDPDNINSVPTPRTYSLGLKIDL